MKIDWKTFWQKVKDFLKNLSCDAPASNSDETSDSEEYGESWKYLSGGGTNGPGSPYMLGEVVINSNNSDNSSSNGSLGNSLRNLTNGFGDIPLAIQETYSYHVYTVPMTNDKILFEVKGKVKLGGENNIIQFNKGGISFTTKIKNLNLLFSKDNLGLQIQYDFKNYSVAYGMAINGTYSMGISTSINNYNQTYCWSYFQNPESRLMSLVGAGIYNSISVPYLLRYNIP